MLTIRKINESDRETYLNFTRLFYNSDAVLHTIPEEYCINTFNEMMRSDVYADGYIFEEDGKNVGYALLSKTFSQEAGGTVIWVEELFILPEYRSRGIGSKFFSFVEQKFEPSRIRLEVEPDNFGAVKLYKKIGYEVLPYEQMIKEFER